MRMYIVTSLHTITLDFLLWLAQLLIWLYGHKLGIPIRKKGEKRCKTSERPKGWKKKKRHEKKHITVNANYTKPSGEGRALLVAGSACKFDLPGSLPYTVLSVLISCNPVAMSETNQTAESSLFLIRKAQDNHLTLWFLSELQAASTEKKNILEKMVAYTL